MPDVVAYASSDSEKYKNNPSHDTLHLLKDTNDKNGDSSFFSANKLPFYGNNTMNCDKISLKKLKNLHSEEVLTNNSEAIASKCNSSISENESTSSDLIYVSELENGINSDFDNEHKNLCNSIANNWDSNLAKKEYIPNNLLQKPNNINYTLSNGSPNLKDVENIESDASALSLNSIVKEAIEENENIKSCQKPLNDSEFTNEPISSKVLIHSTKNVSSKESSLDTTQAATNKSNPINLHDKKVDFVPCREELASYSNEIQNTSESSCDSDDSSQSDNGNKIGQNEKSEAISRTSNFICQKEDLVESSVKEACDSNTQLSENAEQINNLKTKSFDALSIDASNRKPSFSSMENYPKTCKEENLDTTLNSSCRKEIKDSRNLKRKKDTNPNDDNSYDYKDGSTKRLKMVHKSTNDISCQLNEDSIENNIQPVHTCSKSSSSALVKQEKCLNPNELYQGLLNDVLVEDKDLINGPEVVRSKLQRIKRKDLEDMIIDQVMNKVLYDHEFGYQKELCKRLEQTLEAANKRALRLTQEMDSLRNATNKVAAEHKRRKTRLVNPTKVKRSVGIQANKSYISQGISSAFLPNSDATIIIPTKYQRSRKSGSSEVSKTKSKIKSEPTCDTSINKTEEDYNGIGKTIEQKLSTLRKDLMNSEVKSSSSSKDKSGRLSRKHGAVNGKRLRSCDLVKTEIEEDSELPSEPKHPAPLPHIPFDEEELLTWKVPPSPVLKVQLRNKSIILSWNITANYDESLILSYQLFSYEESKEDPPSTDLWQKIGSVKALELPMACTLTQFKCGRMYHFAVRAMTKKGRLGPFSIPISLQMPPK